MMTDGYSGQIRATRRPGGQVTIEQADPRVRITAEFLAVYGDGSPPEAVPWRVGDVVRLHAVNRTVVYRIDGRTEDGDWLASWPD